MRAGGGWRTRLATTAVMTAAIAGQVPTSAAAQEKTPLQLEAEQAAAMATIAESRAKIAAARAETTAAVVEPLTSRAGSGKTELAEGAGRIEAALLGSESLVDLARQIATASGNAGRVVVLADDEPINLAAWQQFEMDSAHIERRLRRVERNGEAVCRPSRDARPAGKPGFLVEPAAGFLAGGPFAALGAIAGLLANDTKVTGVTYLPKARILAALVARDLGENALVPSAFAAPNPKEVVDALVSLDNMEANAATKVSGCNLIAAANRTPAQAAVLTEYTGAAAALGALRSRLYTPDAGGRLPVTDVLLSRRVQQERYRLLRIRVEDGGGSVIQTKNLLTAFGAPALNVTSGLLASYQLTDPTDGQTLGGALYRCWGKARMLRSVHRNVLLNAACRPVSVLRTGA